MQPLPSLIAGLK